MNDVIYLALFAAMMGLAFLYVRLCGWIVGSPELAAVDETAQQDDDVVAVD